VYSLLRSKPGARVIAVEPDEDNFRLLLTNIKVLKNLVEEKRLRVLALRKAVWIKRGTLRFIKTVWSEGRHISNATHHRKTMCVDAITLDDVLDLSTGNVIVKIDIEGAEVAVLASSKKLKKAAQIAVEAHGNERRLLRLLKIHGYDPKIVVHKLSPHLARYWFAVRPRAYGLTIAVYRLLIANIFKPTITVIKALRSRPSDAP